MTIFNVTDFGATGNDSTNDTAAIQAALNAARDAGGGKVYIPDGTYIITGTGKAYEGALRIYSNTELFGDGMGKTELKLQDGWSAKITGLIRTPVNEETHDVVIRDLTLNGNRAKTTADVDGIMTGVLPGSPKQDTNILIERVEIHDVSRIAFNPHEQTTNLIIRDSVAHHNTWDGFVGDFISNSVYENNIAYANDRNGINIVTHSHDVVVRNNTSYDNGQIGIVVQRGSGSTTINGWENMLTNDILVEGNTVYGNYRGIVLKQTENSQIVGNIIHDNIYEGIYLEGSRNNVIDGNKITEDYSGIGLRDYSGSIPGPDASYGNKVLNNVINTTALAIHENGSTTVGNIYAGNLLSSAMKLLSGAIQGTSASDLTYTKISVTAELPSNYHTAEPEPVPVPVPVPAPEPTPVPVPVPVPTPAPAPVTPEKLVLAGTDGVDTLTGDKGNDDIKGRSGNDILTGREGNDYIEGNAGNDRMVGGFGIDTLKGGDGADSFVYQSLQDAGDKILDFRSLAGDKIDLSELMKNAQGFTGAKALTDGFVRFHQNGTDTQLFVDMDGKASGKEVMLVSLTNTQVSKFTLSDLVFGSYLEPAPVTPPVTVPTPPVVVTPPPVIPPVEIPVPAPAITVPTNGNDVLRGTNLGETIKGYDGHDVIYGGGGNDYLEGNAGNDRFIGGAGADKLKGGSGKDVFVYEQILDGGDLISDFRSSEDKIDLAALIDDFVGAKSTTVSGLVKEGYIALQYQGHNVTSLSVDIDGKADSAKSVLLADIDTGANKILDMSAILL
jgi:parallel beta-helix repeat protein